jgi:hypothetical protein
VHVDPAPELDLVPATAVRLKVAGSVVAHLVGGAVQPAEAGLQLGAGVELAWAPPAPLVERMREARARREPLVVEMTGPDMSSVAACVALAEQVGQKLWVLPIDDPESVTETLLLGARRDAQLLDGLLCVHSLGDRPAPPADERPAARTLRLPAPMRRLLESLDGPILFARIEPDALLAQEAPVLSICVPTPSPSARAAKMAEALARAGAPPDETVDLSAIMRRFALDHARTENAAQAAVENAWLDGRARVSRNDLIAACQTQRPHDLGSIATRIATSHRCEDLVIPVEVLDGLCELVAYVRHAERVYAQWGFGVRHSLPGGVSALLAGPPGTGKTMCASVIARELDMELFRVDVSRIVSKWVGETEKNLARVFDEAERSNAIVLFDEADSLFTRRTEVRSSNDRYTNLEVNYLLQRMESFRGVTILTTNLEDSIDPAFRRRLTFRLRFEKPDVEARAALWRKVFPPQCEVAADLDYAELARRFEMSGANIRDTALRAAFMAAEVGAPVDMLLCLEAAERELRELGSLVYSRTSRRQELAATPPAKKRLEPSARLVTVTHPRRFVPGGVR